MLNTSMLKARNLSSYIHVFRSISEVFDPFEVQFDDISLDKIIGEGTFGKVYSGRLLKQTIAVTSRKERKTWRRKTDKKQRQMKMGLTVAVKMLRSTSYML